MAATVIESYFQSMFLYQFGQKVAHKTAPEMAWVVVERRIIQTAGGMDRMYKVSRIGFAGDSRMIQGVPDETPELDDDAAADLALTTYEHELIPFGD